MKLPCDTLSLFVKQILFFLLQSFVLLGAFHLPTSASPMAPSGSGLGHSHDHGSYEHSKEERDHLNSDLHQVNPDWLRLGLGLPDSSSLQHDHRNDQDHIDTPRFMTPRSRNMVERVGRRRQPSDIYTFEATSASNTGNKGMNLDEKGKRRASHSPSPDLRFYHGSSSAAQDDFSLPLHPTREQRGQSSSFPTLEQQEASSSHYGRYHTDGEILEGVPVYSGQLLHNYPIITASSNHIDMQELPVRANTSYDHHVQDQSGEQHENEETHGHPVSVRAEQRAKWERERPNLYIPLRLLSARECAAIKVSRNTDRYMVSLFLEDRYLRSHGIILGPPVPEPPGWQQHSRFPVLTARELDNEMNPKLRETQILLDRLFQEADLYSEITARIQTRQKLEQLEMEKRLRRQQKQQRQKEVQETNEEYYRRWTNEHGILIPLHLMANEDLTAMGLAKGHLKYNIARFFEQQMFLLTNRIHLLGARPAVLPRFTHKHPRYLTEQYEVDPNSFLRLKQLQVQEWLINAGYM